MDPRTLSTRLARLTDLLSRATSFAEPFDYFRDELADVPGFVELGERAHDCQLEQTVAQLASRLLGRRQVDLIAHCFHLPEHGFWHGALLVDDRMGVCFYFEASGRGLLALQQSPREPANLILARFSTLPMSRASFPMRERGCA